MSEEALVCKDCRSTFTISEGEENFLRSTFGDQFRLPVRCVECRRKRRDNRPPQQAAETHREERAPEPRRNYTPDFARVWKDDDGYRSGDRKPFRSKRPKR